MSPARKTRRKLPAPESSRPRQLRWRCDPARFAFKTTEELGDCPINIIGQPRALEALRLGLRVRSRRLQHLRQRERRQRPLDRRPPHAGGAGAGRGAAGRPRLRPQLPRTPISRGCCVFPPGQGKAFREAMDELIESLDPRPAQAVRLRAVPQAPQRDGRGRVEEAEGGVEGVREAGAGARASRWSRSRWGRSCGRSSCRWSRATPWTWTSSRPWSSRGSSSATDFEQAAGKLTAAARPRWRDWASSSATWTASCAGRLAGSTVSWPGRSSRRRSARSGAPSRCEGLDAYLDAGRRGPAGQPGRVPRGSGRAAGGDGPAAARASRPSGAAALPGQRARRQLRDRAGGRSSGRPRRPTATCSARSRRCARSAGEWETDHTRIKGGSLLRANGGFLVLDAMDVLIEPGVWAALKRTLRTRKVEIQSFDPFYMFSGDLAQAGAGADRRQGRDDRHAPHLPRCCTAWTRISRRSSRSRPSSRCTPSSTTTS